MYSNSIQQWSGEYVSGKKSGLVCEVWAAGAENYAGLPVAVCTYDDYAIKSVSLED